MLKEKLIMILQTNKNESISEYMKKHFHTFIYDDFYGFNDGDFCDYKYEKNQKVSSFFQKIYSIGCLGFNYNFDELINEYKNCNKLIDYKILNEYSSCREILINFDNDLKIYLERKKLLKLIDNQLTNKIRKTNKI